ncbi:MAG: UvrD-helicase domain-containing protein [Fusicatenibacter saccharivorans]
MVGDIKQSIYGFRLARPELFLEKYHTYAKDGESQQRIDLDKNFRSRPEVLATANYVFRKLMSPELGGIAYDEAASLHAGAAFPALPEMEEEKTEPWQMRHMKRNFCCWMTRRRSWKMISPARQRWKRRRLPLRRASARWSEMRKSWTKRPGNTGKFSTAIS